MSARTLTLTCAGGHGAALRFDDAKAGVEEFIGSWCATQRRLHLERFPQCSELLELAETRDAEPRMRRRGSSP